MILMAFFTTFAIVSCDFLAGNAAHPDSPGNMISAIDDSIKNHIIKQDSLYGGLWRKWKHSLIP